MGGSKHLVRKETNKKKRKLAYWNHFCIAEDNQICDVDDHESDLIPKTITIRQENIVLWIETVLGGNVLKNFKVPTKRGEKK